MVEMTNIKEIDWKSRFKMTLKIRLAIMGLIFAVVGWFLLGVILFGRLGIEEFLQSTALAWSFRILIIGVAIILVIKREWLTKTLQERKSKVVQYIFYGVGLNGWILGINDFLT